MEAVITRQRSQRRMAGQGLVEFALVLPILLVFFAAAADLGRMFYSYVAIQNAAKEGALYGARYPLCATSSTLCPDPDNVVWRVRHEAGNVTNPDGTPLTPSAECRAPDGTVRADLRQCVPGDTYSVALVYRFGLITPFMSTLVGNELTFGSRATAVVLNQAFDPTPGAGVTKLVLATNARNASTVASSCTEPDPLGSPGFYRAPCLDAGGSPVQIRFRSGDSITYKVIVRNTGGTNLSSLAFSDSLGWPSSCAAPPMSLTVGGTPYTCTYTRTAPAPGSGTEMDYPNTFTADAAEIAPVADYATVRIELPPADLRVVKTLSPYREGDDGDGVPSFGSANTLAATRNTLVPTTTVWFKVRVTNTGGMTASGLVITDSRGALPYGQNTPTAICDAQPASLAPGASFTCRYQVALVAAGTYANTVTATSPDVTPSSTTTDTATVTVSACSGTNRVIPNLVGLTKTAAISAWTAAGFSSSRLTSWSSASTTAVVTQSRLAYQCMPTSTTMTITRTTTP